MTTPGAVAIVAVGDELLRGDIVDTNGAWLGRTLAAAGLPVVHRAVVSDDPADVVAAVREAAHRADVVLLSGGLGPTVDDRTRQAVADLVGEPLIRDEAVADRLQAWFRQRDRPVPPGALVQADRPASAVPLLNSTGSAPGLWLDWDGRVIVAMPGPPRELQPMLLDVVLPRLAERFAAAPVPAEVLRVSLLPESLVAAALAPLTTVDLAYYASPGEVRVRLSGADRDVVAGAAAQARALLGDVVHGDGERTPAESSLLALRDAGWTVAVAESLTGGLLTGALTDVAGASAVVRGGVIAYATDLKASVLGVPVGLLQQHGPVHPEVAVAMAAGVAQVTGADLGVATTGVAGPDPQGGVAPGTAYVAVVGPRGSRVRTVSAPGDRALVRTLTVAHGLDAIRRIATGLPEYSGTANPG